MSIPGVGQLTALAFTAAIDDPGRFRRSRDIGAYLCLVPRRYQSGEVDYTGSISKCGDRRVRTLLYEAANVMLTRYKGPLKLKERALAIGKRSLRRRRGTAARAATRTADRPGMPALARSAWRIKAGLSARGSRTPNTTARPRIWFSRVTRDQAVSCER
jgi:transposase